MKLKNEKMKKLKCSLLSMVFLKARINITKYPEYYQNKKSFAFLRELGLSWELVDTVFSHFASTTMYMDDPYSEDGMKSLQDKVKKLLKPIKK